MMKQILTAQQLIEHYQYGSDTYSLSVVNTLTALLERIDLMSKALDLEEREHGISTNGGMWRFWAQKADELAKRNVELSDQNNQYAQVLRVIRPLLISIKHSNAEVREILESQDYDLVKVSLKV